MRAIPEPPCAALYMYSALWYGNTKMAGLAYRGAPRQAGRPKGGPGPKVWGSRLGTFELIEWLVAWFTLDVVAAEGGVDRPGRLG